MSKRQMSPSERSVAPSASAGGAAIPEKSGRIWIWILALVVTVGALLRLINLGQQPLWLDEVALVNTARDIDDLGFGSVVRTDNVAPLSHWVLWVCIRLFGVSPICVRLPSVMASIATVGLIFMLGSRLFSPRVGLIASCITAMSPFAIWHGQDGRMYAMLMCFATSILLLFWYCTSRNVRVHDWLGLAVLTGLSLYTHQFTVLVSISCGLYLLSRVGLRSGLFWRWCLSQVIAGIIYFPWFVHSLSWAGHVGSAGTAKGSVFAWIPYTLFAYLFGYSLGPSLADLHLGLTALRPYATILVAAVVPIAYCCWLVARWATIPREQVSNARSFVLTVTVTPIVLLTMAPFVTHDVISFNVRYASVAFPGFVVLLAAVLHDTFRLKGSRIAAGWIACLMLWSLYNWYMTPQYSKADARSAAALLRTAWRSDDAIIMSSNTTPVPLAFYGFPLPDNAEVAASSEIERIVERIKSPAWLGSNRAWLVESRTWESDTHHLLRRALDDTALLDQVRHWPGFEIRLYHRTQLSTSSQQ